MRRIARFVDFIWGNGDRRVGVLVCGNRLVERSERSNVAWKASATVRRELGSRYSVGFVRIHGRWQASCQDSMTQERGWAGHKESKEKDGGPIHSNVSEPCS